MANNERFRDDYSFATRDSGAFCAELMEIQKDSTWLDAIPGNELAIKHILPIEAYTASVDYGIPEDILVDTASSEGTNLLLQIGKPYDKKQTYCIRNTGYGGLLQTGVGVTGPGMNRLWKYSNEIFCDTVNTFLSCQPAELKLYHSCGKISGVFSKSYMPMEILDLVHAAEDGMYQKMGTPLFRCGEITHQLSGCTWEFPEVELELAEKYEEILQYKKSYHGTNFVPMVCFHSSNTGASAAVLQPMFCAPGHSPFYVGKGIRIRHDKRRIGSTTGCGMEDFKAQAGEIFTLFQDSFKAMEEMTKIDIQNTQNCFIAACNWCFGQRLPRKLAAAALDTFMQLTDGSFCTAHDIYLGMTRILDEADRAGYNLDRTVEIQESLARLMMAPEKWADFDIAGTVCWNDAKGVA